MILGLSVVMVLRPRENGKYEIVGTSFVHGLNWGESLPGLLPASEWRFQKRWDMDGWWQFVFRNLKSDEVTLFDPRIDWEDLHVAENDPLRDPGISGQGRGDLKRPDVDYLLKHGVPRLPLRTTQPV